MDEGEFGEIYYGPGETKKPSRVTYNEHIAHLKAIVTKDRLFFYDIRDGWDPLYRILNVPVPKRVEFLKMNDAAAMEGLMRATAGRGLMAWMGLSFAAGVSSWSTVRLLLANW